MTRERFVSDGQSSRCRLRAQNRRRLTRDGNESSAIESDDAVCCQLSPIGETARCERNLPRSRRSGDTPQICEVRLVNSPVDASKPRTPELSAVEQLVMLEWSYIASESGSLDMGGGKAKRLRNHIVTITSCCLHLVLENKMHKSVGLETAGTEGAKFLSDERWLSVAQPK